MTAPMMTGMPTPDSATISPNGHHPINPVPVTVPAHPAAPAPQTETPDQPRPPRRWFVALLTLLAWTSATVLSVDGAWRFFSDTLHLPLELCIAAFALFEITVLACALTARHRRLAALKKRREPGQPPERGSGGVAGIAVWISAGLSGMFSASHETLWAGQAARFIAPLMAAFLFELLVSTEVLDASGRRRRINVRFTPERVMVALGLADPTDRTAGDVARDRQIAKLATLCVRAQQAPASKDGSRARTAYQRQLERCNERYGLATDPKLMAQLQRSIALLYGSMESTTADAVAAANPWSGPGSRQGRVSTPTQVTTSGSNRTPQQGSRRPDPGKRDRLSAEDLLAQAEALAAAQPERTWTSIADELGVSATRLRQVRAQFGRTSPTTAE